MEINGIEWAAGLFEGEGTFSIYKVQNRKDSRRVICSLSSNDEDVVKRFHEIIGVGSFLGPYKNRSGTDRWVWQVQNFRDCLKVATMLFPYLGKRRQEKARDMIEQIEGRLYGKP